MGVPEPSSSSPRGKYDVQAVRRAVSILSAFEDVEELSLGELAERVQMPKPTVFRLVSTLEHVGLLERRPSGSYGIGLKLVSLARLTLSRGLPEIARPATQALFRPFGHTVNVGALDRAEIVIVDVLESRHNPRVVSDVGAREALHATALGKAVAAHLEPEHLTELLAHHPLTALTPNTITSRAALDRELALTRERGFATDVRECRIDGHCVAAPIFDHRGIAGAVSISAPSSQIPLDDLPVLASSVVEAARAITQTLGGSQPDAQEEPT